MINRDEDALKKLKEDNGGELPAYAWPGGYPIVYWFDDMEPCCPDCANSSDAYIERQDLTEHHNSEEWLIVGCEIYYEDPPLYCANCNNEIESAYGDPDENKPNETDGLMAV